MQKIVPHLWFDIEAKDAANFYTTVFPNSTIISTITIYNTPSGDCDIVSFNLCGYEFKAMSAGPFFTVNPSISFMVNFDPSQDSDAAVKIDALWEKLIEGGKALMEIGEYPFSKRYGWVQDKYGLSWQLILTNPDGDVRPHIIPSMLFVGDVCGKAEAASDFYISLFKESTRGAVSKYTAGMEPDKEGTTMFTDFTLLGQWFVAMDSAQNHVFSFNEAISFIVRCEDQSEVDYYWNKLSAVPESEQCGWLKDKYGISWQIIPNELEEVIGNGTQAQKDRVTQAFLTMKKLDIPKLKQASENNA